MSVMERKWIKVCLACPKQCKKIYAYILILKCFSFSSSQGLLVATIFCFFNGEVSIYNTTREKKTSKIVTQMLIGTKMKRLELQTLKAEKVICQDLYTSSTMHF